MREDDINAQLIGLGQQKEMQDKSNKQNDINAKTSMKRDTCMCCTCIYTVHRDVCVDINIEMHRYLTVSTSFQLVLNFVQQIIAIVLVQSLLLIIE